MQRESAHKLLKQSSLIAQVFPTAQPSQNEPAQSTSVSSWFLTTGECACAKFVRFNSLLADQTETISVRTTNLISITSAATVSTAVDVGFIGVFERIIAGRHLCLDLRFKRY
jgi:hypothetical protein